MQQINLLVYPKETFIIKTMFILTKISNKENKIMMIITEMLWLY